MNDFTFIYNKSRSYEDNFWRWYALNKAERFSYSQRQYTEEEAKEVFDAQYWPREMTKAHKQIV